MVISANQGSLKVADGDALDPTRAKRPQIGVVCDAGGIRPVLFDPKTQYLL